MKKKRFAFSLIELSIVILIVGIIVAGISQSSRLVGAMRLNSARATTQSSDISSIKDLVLWLEATSDKSFTTDLPDDGTDIEQWNDINPQIVAAARTNALQATLGKKPIYTAKAINGLPALKFDGSASYLSVADGFDGDSRTITAFVVWRSVSLPGVDGAIIEKWSGSSGYSYVLRLTPTNFYAANYDGSNAATATSTTGPSISTPRVVSFTVSYGVSNTIWVNGSQEASNSNTSVNGDTRNDSALYIGARGGESTYSNGYIGEIIIFSRALKSEERSAVEKYLGRKWGIKVL